jgi:hypothetical protein
VVPVSGHIFRIRIVGVVAIDTNGLFCTNGLLIFSTRPSNHDGISPENRHVRHGSAKKILLGVARHQNYRSSWPKNKAARPTIPALKFSSSTAAGKSHLTDRRVLWLSRALKGWHRSA